MRVLIVALFLAAASDLTAQTLASCEVEVPVGVVTPRGVMVQDLPDQAFLLHSKKNLSLIKSHYDTGPRRIVLVIDHGRQFNEASAAITGAILRRILQHARPGDSFALVSSGNDAVSVPLGDPQTVLAKAQELLAGRPAHSAHKELVDSITSVTSLLGPPRLGDSIMLFATDDRLGNGKGSFQSLYSSLVKQQVRVFTVLMGPSFRGTYYNFSLTSSVMVPEAETANALTQRTGGYLVTVNTHDPWHEYKADQEKLEAVANLGWQLYGTVVQFYELSIKLDGPREPVRWELNVGADVRGSKPAVVVTYPRVLQSCSTK